MRSLEKEGVTELSLLVFKAQEVSTYPAVEDYGSKVLT